MSVVKKERRNIFTVWLDYKKAFDSVPHEWLLYALQLAKVPAQLIEAIKHLTNQRDITPEYYTRVKKNWKSNFSSFNKLLLIIHLSYLH